MSGRIIRKDLKGVDRTVDYSVKYNPFCKEDNGEINKPWVEMIRLKVDGKDIKCQHFEDMFYITPQKIILDHIHKAN